MSTSSKIKPLVWVASSKTDLMRLPRRVIREFGFALYTAQVGAAHPNAKPKKSRHGIATPKPDVDLIKERLKAARQMAEEMK